MSLDEPVLSKTAPHDDTEDATLSAGLGRPLPEGWALLATEPPVEEQVDGPTVATQDGQIYAYAGGAAASPWGYVSADNGVTWSRFQATWSPARRGAAGAVFNNTLWLTGGSPQQVGDLLSDTWAAPLSNPGAWGKVDDGAGWGGRWAHRLQVFNGKLYLLGGVQGRAPVGDVWVMGDDGKWSQVNSQAFKPRMNFAVGVVGGQMLVIGGTQDQPADDCAVTSDGQTWRSYPTPWTGARSQFSAVTIGDTLYVVGGLAPTCEIWSTKNGIAWKLEDNQSPWGVIASHGVASVGDHLVVFGGLAGPDWEVNRRTFAFTPRHPGWSRIGRTPLTAQSQRPLVERLNGVTYSLEGYQANPVIASTDNANWNVVQGANLPYRSYAAGCAANNQLWVTGGQDANGTYTQDVFTSADGVSWSSKPQQQWFARRRHAMIARGNVLFVIGGELARGQGLWSDVNWSWDNGGTWGQERMDPFPGRCDMAAVYFQGELWVLGGQGRGGLLNDVWKRNDRTSNWDLMPTPPWSARRRHAAGVVGNKLYVGLGVDASGRSLQDTWVTSDGRSWAPADGGWPAPSLDDNFGSTAVEDSLLVLGGSDTSTGGPNGWIYKYRPV
jgi:N-acetylneuraminic acid mutarotase